MIDPHWLLEDLDPVTWRNIGHLLDPARYIAAAQPGEHGLFILHDGGSRPRAVDTRGGRRADLGLHAVEDARQLARELYARGEWERVHVVDRGHLQRVASQAQATSRRDLTLDAYYHLVYDLIWDDSDGYVCQPARPTSWHGWTYTALVAFAQGLPSPSAVGLCVLDEASVHISLALGLEGGRIQRVTTLEGLPPLPSPRVSDEFFDAFWAALSQGIAPAAAALVCTRPIFDAWLLDDDKLARLDAAARTGAAIWRLAPA